MIGDASDQTASAVHGSFDTGTSRRTNPPLSGIISRNIGAAMKERVAALRDGAVVVRFGRCDARGRAQREVRRWWQRKGWGLLSP
jgi:hypothetical protein